MELTDKDFENEVIKSDIPVLVEFWASWCPPCKMMEPLLVKLLQEYEGRLKIKKINVDRNKATASKHEIRGVPTFIIFEKGKAVESLVAAQTEGGLKQMISKVLK